MVRIKYLTSRTCSTYLTYNIVYCEVNSLSSKCYEILV